LFIQRAEKKQVFSSARRAKARTPKGVTYGRLKPLSEQKNVQTISCVIIQAKNVQTISCIIIRAKLCETYDRRLIHFIISTCMMIK